MTNSLFCTKDAVKYIIVAGITYTILKMIPSVALADKDVLLTVGIVTVIFVLLDCMYNKDAEEFRSVKEHFADVATQPSAQSTQPAQTAQTAQTVVVQAVEETDALKHNDELTALKAKQLEELNLLKAKQEEELKASQAKTTDTAVPAVSCGVEIEKVKQQLSMELEKVKSELAMKSVNPEDKIANKYLDSLVAELTQKGIINETDAQNIQVKLNTKLLSIDQVIESLETLKAQGKSTVSSGISRAEGKSTNDMMYSELPTDFYKPIGDKISSQWDNEFAILNTNKWQVPMARPPVCINTTPCKVCPSESSSGYTNLKEWDNSRQVTQVAINKQWASDQASAVPPPVAVPNANA